MVAVVGGPGRKATPMAGINKRPEDEPLGVDIVRELARRGHEITDAQKANGEQLLKDDAARKR